MQVPFPYFYPSNGTTKSHHFASTIPSNHVNSINDGKLNTKQNAISSESSSSPINFSSRTQNTFVTDSKNISDDLAMTFLHRSPSIANEEIKHDQPDDENVEVD